MPKKAMEYSKSCVYKICCNDTRIKDVYVGSTTNLHKRRSHHKSDCNRPNCKAYNRPVYRFIRDNGGWDDWEVVKIEDCPCECDEDLRRRERHWIETLQATLNIVNPFTGIVAENREEYNKVYYQDRKEYFKAYKQEHKEEISAYRKVYHQEHKAELSAKKAVKVTCEHCQSIVRKGDIARHQKTKRCRRARGEIE